MEDKFPHGVRLKEFKHNVVIDLTDSFQARN